MAQQPCLKGSRLISRYLTLWKHERETESVLKLVWRTTRLCGSERKAPVRMKVPIEAGNPHTAPDKRHNTHFRARAELKCNNEVWPRSLSWSHSVFNIVFSLHVHDMMNVDFILQAIFDSLAHVPMQPYSTWSPWGQEQSSLQLMVLLRVMLHRYCYVL